MYKILVIGSSGVGKTSLVQRIVNNAFDDNYKATISWEFGTKVLEVGGKPCNIQLWDLAGFDRMITTMTKVYCRDAVGALAVCDLTDPETMESVVEWKDQILQSVESDDPIPIFLVATKSDLPHDVSDAALSTCSEQNNFAGFYKVSSKSGENCEATLHSLIKIIKQNRKEKLTPRLTHNEAVLLRQEVRKQSEKAPTKSKSKKSCC